MAISHENCAPYLSTTLLTIERSGSTAATVREAIVAELKKSSDGGGDGSIRRKIQKVDRPTFKHGDVNVAWILYSEAKRPAWYIGNDLREERHHVVFLAQKSDLISLTFSDPALRSSVISEIRKRRTPPLDGLRLLTTKQTNDAFVGDRVRTLWLSGAHRRSSTKADSKILTGIELEAALNPLDDQSYYFSSVRSTLNNFAPAGAKSDVIVGANPRNARIWLGPTKDWRTFITRMETLIDAASQAIKNPSSNLSPLPVLARPVDGVADARKPYDMAIIVPEAVSSGIEESSNETWLREFSDAVHFEVRPMRGSSSFEAEVFWGRESYGKIAYDFSIGVNSPLVKAKVLNWRTDADHQDAIRRMCEDTELLTVYYDTGHTYSRGMFYETVFRDARFESWKWVSLGGFDVSAEKPLEGKKFIIKNIGNDEDKSLFGFVARHWPNFLNRGKSTGWLVCDDGAMESADFIHFDDTTDPPELTLIHVKACSASKQRGLSVSDYEVVVGQAVKNLSVCPKSS